MGNLIDIGMNFCKHFFHDGYKDFFRIRGDRTIWFILCILGLFSLFLIFSATGNLAYVKQDGNTYYYLFKHFIILVLSILAILVMLKIPYRIHMRYAVILCILSIFLLFWAKFFSSSINETGRWIMLGPLSFQPSEIAKIAIMIYMARIVAFNQDDNYYTIKWRHFIMPIAICLIIMTENVSTAILIAASVFLLITAGRLRAKYVIIVLSIGLTIGISGALLIFATPPALVQKIGQSFSPFKRIPTVQARILSFKSDDPNDDHAYQSQQAKIAVANGGITGRGPGNSTQRNFLPHPYSDFVFAIAAEEYGFVGILLIILCYLVFAFAVGRIVWRCTSVFPAMLVVGLGLLIMLQTMMHMAVNVGMMPVTGQPLPFVSMGGTSLIITAASFGIILRVSYEFSPEYEMDQKMDQKNEELYENDEKLNTIES